MYNINREINKKRERLYTSQIRKDGHQQKINLPPSSLVIIIMYTQLRSSTSSIQLWSSGTRV